MRISTAACTAVLAPVAIHAFSVSNHRIGGVSSTTTRGQYGGVVGSFTKAYDLQRQRQHLTTTTTLAAISTDENTPRNIPPFQSWCAEMGVQQMDGLDLYTQDGGVDYMAITTVDIPAGTTILYVPSGMVLSSDRVAEELNAISNGGVADAVNQLGRIGGGSSVPKFYLFIKMLMEYENQENSPFYPWLDSLPRLYFNAVSMTDFCYECLPPLVFNLSRTEKVKFDNFLQVIKKVDVVSDYVKSNEEVLKWAFNSVYTRTYCHKDGQNEDDVALTPFADYFNHGTDTEVEVCFDEEGNCMAYTTTDVAANSPLRISYGCPTNPSFLFARYGFLDQTCPATFCKMMDIPRTPENVNMGMDFSKMLFYHDTGDISQEVLDLVLYAKVLTNLKYDPNRGDVKRQFYDAHMQGDEATKAMMHEQFRPEVVKEILNHVDTFLKLLDSLERKSEGKDAATHPRLPLILEHNQFVKETFWKVKSNLEGVLQQYGGVGGGDAGGFGGGNDGGGQDYYGGDDQSWGGEESWGEDQYQYDESGQYAEAY
jgi:hypothetical protein|eukprot:scaffold2813_cov185-Alexandrium_tamarense.AAC.4